MKKIQFNRELSRLETFDTFGYNKESKELKIFFDDGHTEHFSNISEATIFNFLVSEDKENFLHKNIRKLGLSPKLNSESLSCTYKVLR
ncbi:hypothetical protein JOD43_004454 [Pullulanibacillus pueri]|uniref:KTSC domain-containing protein n=1 Tax=Pullulanibacillus pueri TaxID=1437324 RepID=A0A8J2ZZZ1_9BACL|nr:KTSC domain-containing protein [Pullulanibacillus pueri]MBM7684232.1 hypothetical protein [Pullulanibacillus pueri]GGH89033.1 hypothetical protein GCM10007096_42710 [Pullulanibacillus pueri]